MRHTLGTPQETDACILQEDKEDCFLELATTSDNAFITINSNSKTASEVSHATKYDTKCVLAHVSSTLSEQAYRSCGVTSSPFMTTNSGRHPKLLCRSRTIWDMQMYHGLLEFACCIVQAYKDSLPSIWHSQHYALAEVACPQILTPSWLCSICACMPTCCSPAGAPTGLQQPP